MAGRDRSTTTDDEVAVVEDGEDRCEPFTAPQVADRLADDVHGNTARNYLEDLVAQGDLAAKTVGSGRVWWISWCGE